MVGPGGLGIVDTEVDDGAARSGELDRPAQGTFAAAGFDDDVVAARGVDAPMLSRAWC